MSYTEARNRFETGRLNTDTGVIETLDGCKHSCEEITVTTPLNHKVKVRMKNLGDDVWDTTLVYVRQLIGLENLRGGNTHYKQQPRKR